MEKHAIPGMNAGFGIAISNFCDSTLSFSFVKYGPKGRDDLFFSVFSNYNKSCRLSNNLKELLIEFLISILPSRFSSDFKVAITAAISMCITIILTGKKAEGGANAITHNED